MEFVHLLLYLVSPNACSRARLLLHKPTSTRIPLHIRMSFSKQQRSALQLGALFLFDWDSLAVFAEVSLKTFESTNLTFWR